jgi:hypothetical protein
LIAKTFGYFRDGFDETLPEADAPPVGVITKEHVADPVAASVQIYPG